MGSGLGTELIAAMFSRIAIAGLALLAACSRAPDMATSPLIGTWDLEHPFSAEQKAKFLAQGMKLDEVIEEFCG